MQDAQLISQAGQVESLASDGLVSVSTGAGQPQKNMELAKFADSLGSSVPLQQTSEQVSITGLYARTSDGKMVELTSESVAKVMSNFMGKPIGEKGEYKGDADELSVAGVYACEGLATNVPESIGYLIHFKTGRTAVPDVQQFIEWSNNATYVRSKTGSGVWSTWKRIDNFGYNTLAELSSGVAQQMGYIETKKISDSLAPNSSIEIESDEIGLFLFDAGGGGSEYIYLKRYSGIQLISKTESENFKITVEFVSSGKIKITSVGLGATSVKYKVIKF